MDDDKYKLNQAEQAGLQDIKSRLWNKAEGPTPTIIIGESPNEATSEQPFPAFPESVGNSEVASTKILLGEYGLPREIYETAFRVNAVLTPINPIGRPLEFDGDGTSPDIQIWASLAQSRLDSVLQTVAKTASTRYPFIAAFGIVARYAVFNWLRITPEKRRKCGITKLVPNGFYRDVESSQHGLFNVLFATHPSPYSVEGMSSQNRAAHYDEIAKNVATWSACWRDAASPESKRRARLEARLARGNV